MKTTITLETECKGLGVFLHHPGNTPPDPLPGVSHSVERPLPPGVYAVSATGTGNVPGLEAKVTFATESDSVSRSEWVSDDGSLIAWITFELHADGEVS